MLFQAQGSLKSAQLTGHAKNFGCMSGAIYWNVEPKTALKLIAAAAPL
jgi:hypothetical protein